MANRSNKQLLAPSDLSQQTQQIQDSSHQVFQEPLQFSCPVHKRFKPSAHKTNGFLPGQWLLATHVLDGAGRMCLRLKAMNMSLLNPNTAHIFRLGASRISIPPSSLLRRAGTARAAANASLERRRCPVNFLLRARNEKHGGKDLGVCSWRGRNNIEFQKCKQVVLKDVPSALHGVAIGGQRMCHMLLP